MRFKEPIGQIIGASGQQWHVVGVIKDFILSSPYQPIKPMLIFGPKSGLQVIQIKLNAQKHHRPKPKSHRCDLPKVRP